MQEEFLDLRAPRSASAAAPCSSPRTSSTRSSASCDRVGIIRDGRLVAVEDVAEITGRAYRHVTVEFAAPVDPAEFAGLPGVIELEATGARDHASRRAGDLDAVVKAAARHTVHDIELVQPDARGGLPHLLRHGTAR